MLACGLGRACARARRAFSEIVADAKAKGYTEPDPRDDLNGTDVARKVRGACGARHLTRAAHVP